MVSRNIVSGVTIAGVTGTASMTLPNCSSDGQVDCKAVAAFPAVDKSVLVSSVLRSGVTVAGVTGQYPSATVPLSGADSTPDLNKATFDAKIKSSADFEYFDSAGNRYVNSGDIDIAAANIVASVTIFGTTGTVPLVTPPDPWDLRIGTSVAGVSGKLKTNCRNAVRSAYYNYDGALASIPLTVVNTGTTPDWWDTATDDAQPVPSQLPADWSTDNLCGGISGVAGDDNIWLDVTTGGCDSAIKQCRFRDKISRLEWSEASSASTNWAGAVAGCDGLNWDGLTDWRLPTAKELAAASAHGFTSTAAHSFWIAHTVFNSPIWSATTSSSGSSVVGYYIATAVATNQSKTMSLKYSCVRDAD